MQALVQWFLAIKRGTIEEGSKLKERHSRSGKAPFVFTGTAESYAFSTGWFA
jgi:hypothetical protein